MSGIYYTDMADLFRAAGITIVEYDGWESRARSSGGFAKPPLGVQWHHTASQTEPVNDASWQAEGSDSSPIGNATIMRDGTIWMIAAGAANTAGKGGPITMSRGTVPLDSGNSTTWAFEVANNGVGEAWPQIQIDTYFTASNVANKRFGNLPTDLFTHTGWCEPSCPGRKIDPARAEAVQGPWKPRSINSAGTWNQDDVRAEAQRRWTGAPTEPTEPTEPPSEENDVTRLYLAKLDTNQYHVRRGDGNVATVIRSNEVNTLKSRMDRGDPGRSGSQTYYNPTSDEPIREWAEVPALSEGQLDMDVGYIVIPGDPDEG